MEEKKLLYIVSVDMAIMKKGIDFTQKSRADPLWLSYFIYKNTSVYIPYSFKDQTMADCLSSFGSGSTRS